MKVRFWGVRGSFPVPGAQTNRYGGNTSCVEVQPRRGAPIIIDAGTGIRKLGKQLMQTAFGEGKGKGHLLISHTHWDHIQGLPFFSPFYERGNELHIFARQRDDIHLKAVFASQNENPYFAVPLASLKADISFHELVEGQVFHIDSARISCTRLNHPWIAMAYRIDVDGASVVYASDTAPFRDVLLEQEFIAKPPVVGQLLDPAVVAKLREMRAALVRLCKHADLLIYDTQFTPAEYELRPHWGHSTPDDAIQIARDAGVKRLMLYHHAPARSDDEQDALVERYRVVAKDDAFTLDAAYEGLEVTLGEHD